MSTRENIRLIARTPHSKRSRIIICIKDKTIIIYGLGCKGAYTAGQCLFGECA